MAEIISEVDNMGRLDNTLYLEDLNHIAKMELDWNKLKNASILVTGATGMIGCVLIDAIMYCNQKTGLNCRIYALGRDKSKMEHRFQRYLANPLFCYLILDLNHDQMFLNEQVDYVIHGASTTHPIAYATHPVDTILTNVLGTDSLLRYGVNHGVKRFLFISSVEVYGENTGSKERFTEEDFGYLNCNTLRAGYPEGKRAGEALCQAYAVEYHQDIVIPRLSRTFGPTMQWTDSKAIAQFLKKGLQKENIILKSEGNQYYSYTYVVDAVSGILFCLLQGKNGEAYNIAADGCDITLKELASLIGRLANTTITTAVPSGIEKQGYSTATKALLDSNKIREIGWHSQYPIEQGLARTMRILNEIGENL